MLAFYTFRTLIVLCALNKKCELWQMRNAEWLESIVCRSMQSYYSKEFAEYSF